MKAKIITLDDDSIVGYMMNNEFPSYTVESELDVKPADLEAYRAAVIAGCPISIGKTVVEPIKGGSTKEHKY